MSRLMCAIFTLLILLVAAGSVLAQEYSQVGLYFDTDRLNKTVPWPTQPTVIDMYLVLFRPYDEENGQKVEAVGGFECRVEVPDGDILFGFSSDAIFVNVAYLPEMIIGFAEPLDVVRNKVVLGRLTFFTLGQPDTRYFLTPVVDFPPSLPGQMAFVNVVSSPPAPPQHYLLPMYPAEANDPAAISAAKSLPAEIESESWGGVKALYR